MNEETLTLIVDCEKRIKKISDWEASFIKAMRTCYEKRRELTSSQLEMLNKIWEKATS